MILLYKPFRSPRWKGAILYAKNISIVLIALLLAFTFSGCSNAPTVQGGAGSNTDVANQSELVSSNDQADKLDTAQIDLLADCVTAYLLECFQSPTE